MKINIVGKLPPPMGGVTVHNYRLFKWLEKSNVSVKFLSLNKSHLSQSDHNVEFTGGVFKWMLKKVFSGFDCEILHYQGANYFGLIYLTFLKVICRHDFKLVLTVHGEGYVRRLQKSWLMSLVMTRCLRNVDSIFVGGEHLTKQIASFINKDEHIKCIDAFLPPLDEDRKGLPASMDSLFNDNDFVICANAYNVDLIDSGGDLYGLHIMSDLARKLESLDVDFRMIILIADVNNYNYVNTLFSGLKSTSIVSNSEINGWELISKCDLLIRPTSTDANAISMKEALMFGVDVIASDVVPRYEGVCTFSYPDVDDLLKKVLYSWERGFTKVTVENNIEHYLMSYKKVLGN